MQSESSSPRNLDPSIQAESFLFSYMYNGEFLRVPKAKVVLMAYFSSLTSRLLGTKPGSRTAMIERFWAERGCFEAI